MSKKEKLWETTKEKEKARDGEREYVGAREIVGDSEKEKEIRR